MRLLEMKEAEINMFVIVRNANIFLVCLGFTAIFAAPVKI
jgi:hypothetical protein